MMRSDREIEELYGTFTNIAYRTILFMLKREDPDFAAELAGDGILALDKFNGESDVKTWFHRIARNACLDVLRHQKRWQTKSISELTEREFGELTTTNLAEGWLAYQDLPLNELERGMLDMKIMGYSTEEIAGRFEMPVRTVRDRLATIREKIRREDADSE